MTQVASSFAKRIQRLRTDAQERAGLLLASRAACDVSNSGTISPEDIAGLLRSPEITARWDTARSALSDLGISDRSQGVNAGDRRALYYLMCALGPARVLEIGTHVGASTMHIAAGMRDALRRAGEPSLELTTVDIEDVNDTTARPWERFGSRESPSAIARRLGFQDVIEFVCQPSLGFLGAVRRPYDFVFLDGDHRARAVYREIPRALGVLEPGGFILLHDYFPNGLPLWPQTNPVPGPWLAVERLRSEGMKLRAIPLGTLPWPTKLGSHVTSLALLSRE